MRTFVAIEISDIKVIDSIVKFQNENHFDVKPITSKNLHFTLQFLGEVTEDLSQKIIEIIRKIKFSSFDVYLNGIDAFPNIKFPKIIWIGTDMRGGNLLIGLSQKIQKMLEPLGFFPDKSFKPHITIFRIKKNNEYKIKEVVNYKKMSFGKQKISCIKLKKSELTPKGPIYSDLVEVKAIK